MANLWHVQILTLDYLVEGIFDQDHDQDDSIQSFQAPGDDKQNIKQLISARFQPTHNLALPAGSADAWYVYGDHVVVAVIPRDEASTAFAVKNSKFKSTFLADIYLGAYVIHGTVLSPIPEEYGLNALREYSNFAVKDAQVECHFPGANLPVLSAPFMLVGTHHVQGATLRK